MHCSLETSVSLNSTLTHDYGFFACLVQLVNRAAIHVELSVGVLAVWNDGDWLVVGVSRPPRLLIFGSLNFYAPLVLLIFQMLLILRVLLLSNGRAWPDLLARCCRTEIDLLLCVRNVQLLRLICVNHWLIVVCGTILCIFGVWPRILRQSRLQRSTIGTSPHINPAFQIKWIDWHALLMTPLWVLLGVRGELVVICWRVMI